MKYLMFILTVLFPTLLFAGAQTIEVKAVNAPPVVDGSLKEWGAEGWSKVKVVPTVKDDNLNLTGTIDVELKAVTSGDSVYIAARWPDKAKDVEYKNWVWKEKYERDKKLDDMFAVRFHMSGDYDPSMLAERNYKVDVWLWSSGRSNPAGHASDMWHVITTQAIEDAAEYKSPTGRMIYIKKNKDEGNQPFENKKPRDIKKFEGDKLPGIRMTNDQSGSAADVKAKGVWKDGHWHLEFSRKLNTKNEDDAPFEPGKGILGAIAVFNKAEMEHKSASDSLMFEFEK